MEAATSHGRGAHITSTDAADRQEASHSIQRSHRPKQAACRADRSSAADAQQNATKHGKHTAATIRPRNATTNHRPTAKLTTPGETDRDAQYRHQGCRHFSPTCPRHALLTPTKRSCKPNSGQRMATGIHRGRAGQCPSVVHRKGRGRRTVHNNPRQIQLRAVSQITNYHSPLEHPTSQTYL